MRWHRSLLAIVLVLGACERSKPSTSDAPKPAASNAARDTRKIVRLSAKVIADAKIKTALVAMEVLVGTLDLTGEVTSDPDKTVAVPTGLKTTATWTHWLSWVVRQSATQGSTAVVVPLPRTAMPPGRALGSARVISQPVVALQIAFLLRMRSQLWAGSWFCTHADTVNGATTSSVAEPATLT